MRTTIKADPDKPRENNYIRNLGEAVSQALAAIVGLNANLTFSAYCGYWKEKRLSVKGQFYKVVNLLFMDNNHCQKAWRRRA